MRERPPVCLWVVLMAYQAFGNTLETYDGISKSTAISVLTSTSNKTMNLLARMNSMTADCECVKFFQCNNGTFDKYGSNQILYKIDTSSYNNVLPNRCPDYYTWCCSDPQPGPSVTPGREDPRFEETSTYQTVTVTSTSTSPQLVVESSSHGQKKCGYRKRTSVIQYKIIGRNNEAQPNEFPWMIMVMEKDENNPKVMRYKCGGSLIHERVVLTAAHCAAKIDLQTAVVRAGEHDTRIDGENPRQNRIITKIITHPAYDEDSLLNDISLLVTAEIFHFAPNVNILCLPKEDEVIVDTNCIAPGWGMNSTGYSQRVLKKTTLPIVPRDECQSKLRKTEELGADFDLHESFICAGGFNGQDTCQGDGGGPLICPIKGEQDRYQQVGIVAWGIRCGEPLPAAYVNVAHFRSWIDGEMKKLGFTTDYSYLESALLQSPGIV